ncbi:MAG: hypothetical protein ACOY3I_06975 [Verrucomicrobiota bacterium]
MPETRYNTAETPEYRIYRYGQIGEKWGQILCALAGAGFPFLLSPEEFSISHSWWMGGGALLGWILGWFIGGCVGRNWARLTNSSSQTFEHGDSETKIADPSLPHKKSTERSLQKSAGKTLDDDEERPLTAEQIVEQEKLRKAQLAAAHLVSQKRAEGAKKERTEAEAKKIPNVSSSQKQPPASGGGRAM